MCPAIWLLNVSTNGILRLAGLDGAPGHETNRSAQEIKLILRDSRASGKFTPGTLIGKGRLPMMITGCASSSAPQPRLLHSAIALVGTLHSAILTLK